VLIERRRFILRAQYAHSDPHGFRFSSTLAQAFAGGALDGTEQIFDDAPLSGLDFGREVHARAQLAVDVDGSTRQAQRYSNSH